MLRFSFDHRTLFIHFPCSMFISLFWTIIVCYFDCPLYLYNSSHKSHCCYLQILSGLFIHIPRFTTQKLERFDITFLLYYCYFVLILTIFVFEIKYNIEMLCTRTEFILHFSISRHEMRDELAKTGGNIMQPLCSRALRKQKHS